METFWVQAAILRAFPGLQAPSRESWASEAVLGRIHKEVVAVLGSAAAVEKLKAQLMVPIASSPAAFKAVLREEHNRWVPIITAGGIKVE